MDEARGTDRRRPVFWVLFPAALLLFLLAKNIATSGAVTIDRFEYWFVGLLPILAYYGLDRLINPGRDRFGQVFSAGLAAWILTLAAYLALQFVFVSEVFEFPIQEKFGYATPASSAVTAGIYATAGFGCSLLLPRHNSTAGLGTIAVVFVTNWLLFFSLVFAI